MKKLLLWVAAAMVGIASVAVADQHGEGNMGVCSGYGPQTPRDIDQLNGSNPQQFSLAPPSSQMNLCNIHFHAQAEHRAKAFSIPAGGNDDGHGDGYRCEISQNLTARQLARPRVNHCEGVVPGDTIEVHWVHSSCAVKPGPGLGSCLSEQCANPDLRVETQVFTVVNDDNAMDFGDLVYDGHVVNGRHQARQIPDTTGAPVVFQGSTTGPSYSQEKCSSLQVTWSVRPQCALVSIESLSDWCEDNVFEEDHPHGVRPLVTHPDLLAPIR